MPRGRRGDGLRGWRLYGNDERVDHRGIVAKLHEQPTVDRVRDGQRRAGKPVRNVYGVLEGRIVSQCVEEKQIGADQPAGPHRARRAVQLADRWEAHESDERLPVSGDTVLDDAIAQAAGGRRSESLAGVECGDRYMQVLQSQPVGQRERRRERAAGRLDLDFLMAREGRWSL